MISNLVMKLLLGVKLSGRTYFKLNQILLIKIIKECMVQPLLNSHPQGNVQRRLKRELAAQ